MRQTLVASLSLFAFLSGSATAQWTAFDLHPVDGTESRANSVWGDQIGGYVMVNAMERGSLWGTAESSGWVDLTPEGALGSIVRGVRNGRQAGSIIFDPLPRDERGGSWTGTAATWDPVGSPGGLSIVYGLSDDQLVGYTPYTPTLWMADGRQVDLGVGTVGTAFGVDRHRQVGTAGHDALLWNDGARGAVYLRPPGFSDSGALGIHGDEQVGFVGSSVRFQWAALWRGSAESFVSLNPSADYNTGAVAVFRGRQAGHAFGSVPHAAVWHGTAGSFVDLHASLPAGYLNSRAKSIWWGRDVIRVVGHARHIATNRDHAILWTHSRCPADFNDDGVADEADLAAFLSAFGDAESISRDLLDYDDDGSVDFFDWIAFLDALDIGCDEVD
jgi:hypothetical protein